MALGISSANMADQWLNWIRATATTAPASTNVKLHTADPGAVGTTAAAAGDTTRKVATFAAPTGTTTRAIALTGNVGPWTNGGTSETISHVSVWSDIAAGNFLWDAALSASQAWVNTNTFTLTTLGVSITPVAT